MPRSPSGSPGPLANLPRPLAERERRRGRGRGLLNLVGIAALIGVTVVLVHAILPAVIAPVGAVAGAAATDTAVPVVSASVPASAVAAAEASPSAAAGLPLTGAPGIVSAGPGGMIVVDPPEVPAPSTALPAAELTGYRWPLAHGRITLPFGPTAWGSKVVNGKLFHDGIDLATFCGDRVLAAHAGTVLDVGRHFDDDMGWVGDLQPYYARLDKLHLWFELPIVVIVDDGNGYRSVYAHFSKTVVKRGQQIKAGTFLGYEGMTGRATGCHVHYGLFSPLETRMFGIESGVVSRMKVPRHEIARIDPLLVLPKRNAPRSSAGSPGTDEPPSP